MQSLKIQNVKVNIEEVCDFLYSDTDFDLFIQIEMKNCDYHRIEYNKKNIEIFHRDLKRIEKVLVKECHLTNYKERKCS